MARLLVNAKAGIEHLAERLENVKLQEGGKLDMSDETVWTLPPCMFQMPVYTVSSPSKYVRGPLKRICNHKNTFGIL